MKVRHAGGAGRVPDARRPMRQALDELEREGFRVVHVDVGRVEHEPLEARPREHGREGEPFAR